MTGVTGHGDMMESGCGGMERRAEGVTLDRKSEDSLRKQCRQKVSVDKGSDL